MIRRLRHAFGKVGGMKRRLFFGVRPSKEILEDLAAFQQALKQGPPLNSHPGQSRWVSPLNFHLTVHFLGDRGAAQAKVMIENAAALFRKARGGQQLFSNVMFFPTGPLVRVLALGCTRTEPFLIDLQQSSGAGLKDLGFELESRPYVPHLTLARFRTWLARPRLSLPPRELLFHINSVTLFESSVGGGTPVYRTIQEFRLAEA